jgi:D-psicose/D-tagatose/L-ribulose 3-epimerase
VRHAVSNIAWGPAEDDAAPGYLSEHGAEGLEVAPTRAWPDWEGAGPASAAALRRRLEASGLACPALQAVLFGRPELQLFGTPEQGRALREHLVFVAELAAELGAGIVVFGSPGNRVRDGLPMDEAWSRAVAFFQEVGADYERIGARLGFEANPPEYGCDFVTRLDEARRLVREVGSPGFVLHGDAGGLILTGEDASILGEVAPELGHFHASDPFLAPLGSSDAHAAFGRALAEGGYRGWCSVEMRRAGPGLDHVGAALATLAACYGDDAA